MPAKQPSADSPIDDKPGTWIPVAVFSVALLYATVRYNIFGSVSWAHWPAYVVNKAFSWSALALIGIAFSAPNGRRFGASIPAGRIAVAGSLLAMAHITTTLFLGKQYYPKLLQQDLTWAWRGELAWLFGALAAMMLFATRWGWKGLGGPATVLALGIAHVAAIGGPGWLSPGTWHGFLPPITLLAALGALVALGLGWRARSSSVG